MKGKKRSGVKGKGEGKRKNIEVSIKRRTRKAEKENAMQRDDLKARGLREREGVTQVFALYRAADSWILGNVINQVVPKQIM